MRRHSYSIRPSMPQRRIQKPIEVDTDKVAEVICTPHGRERDLKSLELTDDQLALYMELLVIPGTLDQYRDSTSAYWQYIAKHPEVYNADGSIHWGRDELKHE